MDRLRKIDNEMQYLQLSVPQKRMLTVSLQTDLKAFANKMEVQETNFLRETLTDGVEEGWMPLADICKLEQTCSALRNRRGCSRPVAD